LPPDSSGDRVTTVPYVLGGTDAAGRTAIQNASLTVGAVSSVVDLSPAGTVLQQSVPAGTVAPVGTAVALVESSGGVQVPDLASLTQSAAVSVLTARGLVASVGLQKACIDPGYVINQSPSGGAVVALGTTVHFTVDNAASNCILK